MKEKNNKGQSTIEFIMTFSAAVGFIFLFLKMALNYTDGFMVHHATFMASRAYLVGDDNQSSPSGGDSQAFAIAKTVFAKNLPTSLMPKFDGVLKENNPDVVGFSAFVGLWTEFTQPFSIGLIGGKDKVAYRSESFLGREPTRGETSFQTCIAISTVTKSSCEIEATLDDNGG
ncbi:MAG: hypothetical protein Q7U04_11225 [Bacteriovorax sp.]|nr:hypothetical protein [Bacteriovorax sp.]